jgi:hypothetical protein
MPPPQATAVTSGLNTVHIAPRTPRTPRTPWSGIDEDDTTQETELSLLGEEEMRQAAEGLGDTKEQGYIDEPDLKRLMSPKDQRGVALLIILCELWPPSWHRVLSNSLRHDSRSSCKLSNLR